MRLFDYVKAGIACVAFICAIGLCGAIELHDIKEAKVYDIKENIVTIVTVDGNLWDIEADGYNKGEAVKVVFDNKGTTSVYDDAIVSIKKIK